MSTKAKVWLGYFFLALIMSLMLFLGAGTVRYWQAWAYLVVFFGSTLAITLYLGRKDPALLGRRASGGFTAEKRTAEKVIMLFASLGFTGLVLIPGLDRRWHWSYVPAWLTILGDLLFIIGWIIIFFVFRVNSYAASTIEIASDQKVITTGPYAIVRHPMYAGAFLYCLGTPLGLGFYWGFLGLAFMLPFLIWRIFDEEKFLSQNLAGYTDYCGRVRWRLIPKIF
jgi:protein-S-isoprenylcysteine O-methyltransferase Ste14